MPNRMYVWWMFYKTFAPTALILTVCCCGIFYFIGTDSLYPIALIKVFSGAIIYYAVNILNSRKLIFYYNLHYQPRQLWVAAFCIDTLILAALLMVIQILG